MKKSLLPILILGVCAVGAVPSHAQVWNQSTGGNWDTATNWTPNTIPNAIGATANITNLTAAGSYTINATTASTFTVGRLDFGTNSSANGIGLTLGNNVGLVFDVASGNAQLNLGTGGTTGGTSSLVINSAIQLNDNLTSTVVRNGGNQVSPQFTGAINLQGNTWTVGSMQQGLRFDGLISGTGGSFGFTTDHGSVRTTTFTNTASTFTGGVAIGRNNMVQLGTGSGSFTGTGGGGVLGNGTISVVANSSTNDGNAATLQSNGAAFANASDTTTNVLSNNIDVASGRVLRIDTPRDMNYTGVLSGNGTVVKSFGASNGIRVFAINTGNSTFTGTVEVQDGQLNTRVTDALGSGATIKLNPTSNTNGVGLFGSTVSGTDVTIGSTLVFQRTASGNSQFIATSGGSTYTLSGNFSNAGSGTAGYIGVGRGNGVLTNGGGGYAIGTNSGTATVRLTGTGTLENNIGIVNGSFTTSALSLGNTAGTQTFTGIISGNGNLIRNGAGGTSVLSGVNTYNGTTTVTAGRLNVDGTHGAASVVGAYSVNGGILGGNGTIKAATGSTTAIAVTSSGVLTAGTEGGVGNLKLDGSATTGAILSMASGTTFTFDIGATGDKISFWNYAGATDFVRNNNTVNINFIGGATLGTYTLFDFYSDSGTTAAASGITNGLTLGTLPSGWAANLVYNTNSIDLQLTAIPEPSQAAAAILCLLMVLVMARRRRILGNDA